MVLSKLVSQFFVNPIWVFLPLNFEKHSISFIGKMISLFLEITTGPNIRIANVYGSHLHDSLPPRSLHVKIIVLNFW